jgi:hypothetical protein
VTSGRAAGAGGPASSTAGSFFGHPRRSTGTKVVNAKNTAAWRMGEPVMADEPTSIHGESQQRGEKGGGEKNPDVGLSSRGTVA